MVVPTDAKAEVEVSLGTVSEMVVPTEEDFRQAAGSESQERWMLMCKQK